MKYTQRYYPSNLQDSKIKNAITGQVYENCLVGSITENNFSGEDCNSTAKSIRQQSYFL